MKSLLKFLTMAAAVLSAAFGALHFLRIRSPRTASLVIFKMLGGSLAAAWAGLGAVAALAGMVLNAPLAVALGGLGALLSGQYVWRVTAPHDAFDKAFGREWPGRLLVSPGAGLLPRRWVGVLRPAAGPEPRWERDVAFWTIPGTDRRLLCDVWQPPESVAASGLAFVYFHGSGWHFLDKDFNTRPFFRHLAAQGHVVMDVAYRLCPETEFFGMLGDAKRAIAWMKQNAARYGVDPARVMAGGGSAGGHLALLAAYAPNHPQLTPADVAGQNLSVRGVVSYYGPSDMRLYNAHAGQALGSSMQSGPRRSPGLMQRLSDKLTTLTTAAGFDWSKMPAVTHPQMMRNLLGGAPDEVPETYALASPVTHVSAACPPTLLLQGEHDMLVSVEGVRLLHQKLVEAGVPVVYVEFPQTEHAFDVAILPQWSPAAQAALFDVDRFLALMAGQ